MSAECDIHGCDLVYDGPDMVCMWCRFEDKVTALEADLEAANKWKDTLIDSAVVHWCLTEENKDDPYKMLMDICKTAIEWENDPAISESAAKRKQDLEAATLRATEAEAERDKLRTVDYVCQNGVCEAFEYGGLCRCAALSNELPAITTERDDYLAGLREAVAALRNTIHPEDEPCLLCATLASLESRFPALKEVTT